MKGSKVLLDDFIFLWVNQSSAVLSGCICTTKSALDLSEDYSSSFPATLLNFL